jgi:predicted RNA-binding protein associated with RNAse of E/G family
MPKLIRYEYGRLGRDTVVYDQWLVVDRADVKVLLLKEHEGRSVTAGGKIVLEPAAPVVWFVFPDAWHDVGRFHLADGTFTGWYTNMCTPVLMSNTKWSSTDLFLDHWQPVEGSGEWLDEDEYQSAVQSNLVDLPTRARVDDERREIEARLTAADWPPPFAKTVDLAETMRIMDNVSS